MAYHTQSHKSEPLIGSGWSGTCMENAVTLMMAHFGAWDNERGICFNGNGLSPIACDVTAVLMQFLFPVYFFVQCLQDVFFPPA